VAGKGRPVTEPDIGPYFEEFTPTPKQLRALVRLVRSAHKSWGIDFGNAFIEATLVLAPGDLSRLSPSAYDLLKRCQSRVWEFRVRLDERYRPFGNETYGQLFTLLVSLGLISDATSRHKLRGSNTVSDLRSWLRSRGLSSGGRKEELVDRVVENLAPEELEAQVSGVILYGTTGAGDKALGALRDLRPRVQAAFYAAVVGTRERFEHQQRPAELPAGVLYHDGDVRITEDDVVRVLHGLKTVAARPRPNAETGPRAMVLTAAAIDQIVAQIDSSGGGWLRIQITQREDSPFVQASWQGTYPDRQWYCDARGNTDVLATVGLTRAGDGPLPMSWVPHAQVGGVLLETLRIAMGANLGDIVWISCELDDMGTD
jgi:hypothetical protein